MVFVNYIAFKEDIFFYIKLFIYNIKNKNYISFKDITF